MRPGASRPFAERTHCLAPSRVRSTGHAVTQATPYARLFAGLPTLDADEQMLHAIGRAGGLCECTDVEDTPESLGEAAAGWPIFGQFVAHDITGDRSALQSHVDQTDLRNARTPRLDLDCLYGDGPIGHPFLFQRDDPAKFLLGAGAVDVPRNAEGVAIIGDPRNDSHLLMAQMHLAMLQVHNALVDEVRARGPQASHVFESAARETRWNYQWIVLNEFLPTLVGRSLVDQIIADGPRWFAPTSDPFIPLEFADGAYRYGHGQIRCRYQLNGGSEPVPMFPDLLGFRPVPRDRTVDWTLFFDSDGRPTAQRARKMDARLVQSLIHLPVAITGECDIDEYHSLAVRDLQRGQGVGLPSGEAVARHMGIEPLTREEIGLASVGWSGETPLWFYTLREAAVRADGHRLGPVGGRIVAEVLIGLIERDPGSVRNAGSGWRPIGNLADLFAGASASSPQ
jgi:Animal haem peroxidase